MPGRTKRDNLKRSAAQVVNHYTTSILILDALADEFRAQHPEHAEGLDAVALATNQLRDAMLEFALVAWSLDEERLQSYV